MCTLFSCRALGLTSLAVATVLAAHPARAESYVIDPKNTEVRFTYVFGYSTQRGRFTAVRGAVDYDAKVPERTRVNAVIRTASLTTGEPAVESELKGRAFFDVERQPEIKFQSQSIRMTGSEAAQMTGAITVNGITKPITLDVAIKTGDDPALKHRVGSQRFSAVGRIKRSDFKMTGYSSMVDDEIGIEIDALLKRQDTRTSASATTSVSGAR